MHELTITGPGPARRILLAEGIHYVGRIPENEIYLEGDGISREHAKLVVEGETALVEDLESRNGTQLGGEPISSRRLADGDVVTIGSYSLLYRFTPDPREAAAPSPPVAAGADERIDTRLAWDEDLVQSWPDTPGEATEVSEPEPVGATTGASTRMAAQAPASPMPARARTAGPRLTFGQAVSEESDPGVEEPGARRPRMRFGRAAAPAAPVVQDEPKPRRLRVNFRARLAAGMLLIVAMAVALLGFGVSGEAEKMMAVEAQARAQTLAYLLAEMNIGRLQAGDARLITEPIAEQTGVRRALILDERGQVIAPDTARGQGGEAIRLAHESPKLLRQITPGGAVFSVPILIGGRRHGTAVLDFSIDYLKENKEHLGKFVLVLGLLLAALGLLGAGLLERLCHRPFRALAGEVDLALKQDLRLEVPLTSDRQVNQLVDALNRLILRARDLKVQAPAPSRAAPAEAASGLVHGVTDVVTQGLLLIDADGLVEVFNAEASRLLACSGPPRPGAHLLDALSDSPYLGELLALLKDSRQAPGQTLVQPLKAGALRARAQSFSTGGALVTLVALEPGV
jgi:hypothetical protein